MCVSVWWRCARRDLGTQCHPRDWQSNGLNGGNGGGDSSSMVLLADTRRSKKITARAPTVQPYLSIHTVNILDISFYRNQHWLYKRLHTWTVKRVCVLVCVGNGLEQIKLDQHRKNTVAGDGRYLILVMAEYPEHSVKYRRALVNASKCGNDITFSQKSKLLWKEREENKDLVAIEFLIKGVAR